MATTVSTLIIPVESQVRELDAKLLLACAAAERGFPVILGSRAFVHYAVDSIPRGVYLAKSMRSLSERMFGILRDLGHDIVAWDEEGLVRWSREDYYRRRLSPIAFGRVAHVFAWGEDDAEVFRGYPHYHGAPIHVTGNPRVDLMRDELRPMYEEAVQAVRERFGRMILVNTNFGYVNAFVAGLNLLQGGEPGSNAIGMTPEFARGVADHKQKMFERFRELVPLLSGMFPEHSIVVRPHPAERHEPWQEAAAGHERVHVVNEGTAIPWLIAADLLIHNGCTTALEAAILGTPALAYRPITSERYDLSLPNSVSVCVSDHGEVERRGHDVLAGEVAQPDAAEKRRILDRHVAAVSGPLATDRVLDVLVKAGYADAAPPAPPLVRRIVGSGHSRGRALFKQVRMRMRGNRNSAEFHAHRFPDVTAADLQRRIDWFGRQLRRFDGVRAVEHSDHIFRIARS